jgi:putative endonuclease
MTSANSLRSVTNYHAGAAAEQSVAHWYSRQGCHIDQMRWRGKGGEIDLIVQDGGELVFVEVKKSQSFYHAAQSLSRRQINRIIVAAGEYLGTQPMGTLTPSRFDVALVDKVGQVEVLKNAFYGD